MVQKRWEMYQENSLLARQIAEELGISPLTAQILINRGIVTIKEAEQFFQTDLGNLGDPFLFAAMERAVERLLRGIQTGEKIVVFGDYDVDGITGTSLLWRVLTRAGARVDYYIPDRSEGYGMNLEAVQRLAQGGYTLIVTVDNGISCYEEVELASSLGVDVLITDHHEPPERIPSAYAVLNPKVPGSGYPFPYLAGVGVGFKLCQALALRQRSDDLTEYVMEQLDLVTLGTIADIVPLIGENRVIAANGLKQITHSDNPGIRALIQVAEMEGKEINAGHVGFILGPRINAIGRLDNPCLGVELLTTWDLQYARELAEKLNQTNRKRQMMEEVILKSAIEQIEKDRLQDGYGLVLASEDWHHGIIGIAASKLVDRYYRPTILISIHDGIGKGSARGVRGVNLFEALSHCQEYLIGYGGHDMAAGLSIHIDQIQPFTEAFQQYVESVLKPEDLVPFVKVDAVMNMDVMELSLLDELQRLEPHGPGNPRPILGLRRVAHQHNLVGANKDHLKLQVMAGERKVGGIGFGMARRSQELEESSQIDVIFNLERNHWQGRDDLQMMLIDLRPAEMNTFERLFAKAEEYLVRKSSESVLNSADRLRRRMMLAEESDAELMGAIGRALHTDPLLEREQAEKLFRSLLEGQKVLTIPGDDLDTLQVIYSFSAYQALRWGRSTFILLPTRGQVERQYLQMWRKFEELGLSMCKATGSPETTEADQFLHGMKNGEIDVLLTTPAYWEAHWDTVQLIKERVGFLALVGAEKWDNTPDIATRYPGLYHWITVREQRRLGILVTWSIADKRVVETVRNQWAMDEVLHMVEDRFHRILVDRRNPGDRDAELIAILSQGEKSLVWVHSPQAAVQVAGWIQRTLPEQKETVLYYHEGLSATDQEWVTKTFQTGEGKVLVATTAFAAYDIADIRHVIFYHLSWDLADFLRQSRLAGLDEKTAWIHLLYGKTDQTANEMLLAPRAPERDMLVKIYVVLEKMAASQGEIKLSFERMERVLGLRGGEMDRLTVNHALQIFAELQLVELKAEDEHWSIRMLPKPKQKLDLSSSIRYNEGVVDKSAFYEFCKVALNVSTKTISEKILPPIIPEDYLIKGGSS